jgi:hypothetical protein
MMSKQLRLRSLSGAKYKDKVATASAITKVKQMATASVIAKVEQNMHDDCKRNCCFILVDHPY